MTRFALLSESELCFRSEEKNAKRIQKAIVALNSLVVTCRKNAELRCKTKYYRTPSNPSLQHGWQLAKIPAKIEYFFENRQNSFYLASKLGSVVK